MGALLACGASVDKATELVRSWESGLLVPPSPPEAPEGAHHTPQPWKRRELEEPTEIVPESGIGS